MRTICWNGHEFEYLQDQTTCPICGEYGQHDRRRRFAPGEKEEIDKRLREAQERNLVDPQYNYDKGYREGSGARVEASRNLVV